MPLIEIIFTCWLILLSNGDVYCYCQDEAPVVQTKQVQSLTTSPLPDGKTNVIE
jgi:hypothetical protein